MQPKKYQVHEREELIQFDQVKEFQCSVCLDTLFQPVVYDCNIHTICQDCVLNIDKCPLCRKNITEVKPNIQLRQTLNIQKCQCPLGCGLIYYEELYSHKINCSKQSKSNQIIAQTLVMIKEKMIEILNKEINPHLYQVHRNIFDDFLRNWEWLDYLNDDWKWWWWSHVAWWKNESCQKCNDLWHKYEDEIQEYENIRINLLKQL